MSPDMDPDEVAAMRGCVEPAEQQIVPWDREERRCPWSQRDVLAEQVIAIWLDWRRFQIVPLGLERLTDVPAVLWGLLRLCESERALALEARREHERKKREAADRSRAQNAAMTPRTRMR